VQITDVGNLERAVRIAERTFEKLEHTPVNAYGFNFTHHKKTRLSKVRTVLGRLVLSLPLGLAAKSNEEHAAKINYQHGAAGRVVSIGIEPSVRGDDSVYVAINIEYRPIVKEGEYKTFHLNLIDRFAKDRTDAQLQLDAVVEAINLLQEN
jgi:hypothetical protein